MIAIIGAGPVGSFTAYLLAKQNKEVTVFEEHKEIGLPVQCTGIVTSLIKDIIPIKKDFIINEISKARIFAPNNNFVEVNLKEKDIVFDRHLFDIYVSDLAKKEGVKFLLNHKFIDNKNNFAAIIDKNSSVKKDIRFEKLIGADGPLSQVAKSNGLFQKREFWQGIQARVKIKNDNCVEFYPYFGTYAWVVPENEETVRIGLASKRYAKTLFNNFLFKFKKLNKKDIIEYQAGLIPQYQPNIKTQKGSIYIVGDAACQVKATTGGGIIPGLKAARALSNSIIKDKNYDKEWQKIIGKELYLHHKARSIMDKFKQEDWNKLIGIMNSSAAKSILGKEKRDNLPSMLTRLIIKKPELLYFIKYIL